MYWVIISTVLTDFSVSIFVLPFSAPTPIFSALLCTHLSHLSSQYTSADFYASYFQYDYSSYTIHLAQGCNTHKNIFSILEEIISSPQLKINSMTTISIQNLSPL